MHVLMCTYCKFIKSLKFLEALSQTCSNNRESFQNVLSVNYSIPNSKIHTLINDDQRKLNCKESPYCAKHKVRPSVGYGGKETQGGSVAMALGTALPSSQAPANGRRHFISS